MDKKKLRSRLRIGAYVLIAAMAVIFFLIATLHFRLNEDYKSFFLNLSTEFVGAFLFFIILQFFLSDPEGQISDMLESMSALHPANSEFKTEEYQSFDKFFQSLKDKKVTHIDMIGYSMAHVFQRYKKEVVELVDHGARVRILVLDPASTAGKLMAETVGEPTLVSEPHERTLRYIKSITLTMQQLPKCKATLQLRTISWIPSALSC